ncbi:MAG: substrate-binding domain-containing protein [Christensenellales bacterium]|jgi:ribose transport system substrate-binding protein
MKKILTTLLVLVLLLGNVAGAETIRVASHNAVVEGNAYRVQYEIDIQAAAQAAAEFGFDVSYSSFVANKDPSLESQMLEQSINEGYDIILIDPISPTGLDPIIEKAKSAGIIWLNCDCEYYSDEIINVCLDQYQWAYDGAKFLAEKLGKGAKIVVFDAIDGNAANEQREAAFNDIIAEYELEVVKRVNHNWDAALAQQLMTEIINSGVEYDGILCSNQAFFIFNALNEANAAYPKAIAVDDHTGWAQNMLTLNAEKEVVPYLFISNTPGVGAIALNIGLNMLAGHELRDDIYGNPDYNSIYVASTFQFSYENQEDYREYMMALNTNNKATFWYTYDECTERYFK